MAGDKLYDLVWLAENKDSKYMNKYFAYKEVSNDAIWHDIILLKPLGGFQPYTRFRSAALSYDTFEFLFFKKDESEACARVPVCLY